LATHLEIKKIIVYNLDLFGLTCANCALRIGKGLSKMEGVTDVRVNFATESIFLRTTDSIQIESIIKKVEILRYQASEKDSNKQSEVEKNIKTRCDY